jgi:hypothetical protein
VAEQESVEPLRVQGFPARVAPVTMRGGSEMVTVRDALPTLRTDSATEMETTRTDASATKASLVFFVNMARRHGALNAFKAEAILTLESVEGGL